MTGMPGLPLLLYFIQEREAIRIKKERGDPWPWTKDPVLSMYRFCNVRREDDKETRLIHQNWLKPHAEDPDLWFAMTVARLVNWWPSLEPMGYPVPWKPAKFTQVMQARAKAGEKQFTGAYMVRADPHVSGSKAAYIAEMVLTPLWQARAQVRPRRGDTLAAFHARLLPFKDMGPFIAGQIVADAKWGSGPLSQAEDLLDWATPGPGSQRGLNVVYGRPVETSWPRSSWQEHFVAVLKEVRKRHPNLDGQNLQNCLCETMKLHRGSSRSKYARVSTN